MNPHLAAPLLSHWLTPLKDFMHDKWRREAEREHVWKVLGGWTVMVGTERKKNDGAGEWVGCGGKHP